jgi:outer membrane murein-binding lipoprotein Lpp
MIEVSHSTPQRPSRFLMAGLLFSYLILGGYSLGAAVAHAQVPPATAAPTFSGEQSPQPSEMEQNAELIGRLNGAIARKVASIERLAREVRALHREADRRNLHIPTMADEYSDVPLGPPGAGIQSALDHQRFEIFELRHDLAAKMNLEERLKSRRDQLRQALQAAKKHKGTGV